jgi:hypothetical protein
LGGRGGGAAGHSISEQRPSRPQRQPDRHYDPLTTRPNPNGSGVIRDPFPGNVIPANRIDPVGRNVASIYPLPNGPGNFDNYTSTVDRSVRDHGFTGRIDHRAGSRDNFFARFSYEKYKLDAPQGQAACCLPTPESAAQAFDLGPFVAGIQNTRLTTLGDNRSMQFALKLDF